MQGKTQNPLTLLIEIYGEKFHDALKAGDITKATRMCADYNDPDTGGQLPDWDRIRAFLFRVGMESLKHLEIGSHKITIKVSEPEYFHYLHSVMRSPDATEILAGTRLDINKQFEMFGITITR